MFFSDYWPYRSSIRIEFLRGEPLITATLQVTDYQRFLVLLGGIERSKQSSRHRIRKKSYRDDSAHSEHLGTTFDAASELLVAEAVPEGWVVDVNKREATYAALVMAQSPPQ